jgi:hypothetical protein
MIIEDDRVRTMLAEIRHSKISFNGMGLYWITDIEESGAL